MCSEEDGSMHISALQPPICPTSSRLTTLRLDFRLPSSLPPEDIKNGVKIVLANHPHSKTMALKGQAP
eukprot:1156574-Pelagomonas_calceolata.AAC.1